MSVKQIESIRDEFRRHQQKPLRLKSKALQLALLIEEYLRGKNEPVTAKAIATEFEVSRAYVQNVLFAVKDDMGLIGDRHGWRLKHAEAAKPAERVEAYREDEKIPDVMPLPEPELKPVAPPKKYKSVSPLLKMCNPVDQASNL